MKVIALPHENHAEDDYGLSEVDEFMYCTAG